MNWLNWLQDVAILSLLGSLAFCTTVYHRRIKTLENALKMRAIIAGGEEYPILVTTRMPMQPGDTLDIRTHHSNELVGTLHALAFGVFTVTVR